MDKITVSAVSYLNTKPFLYGLENSRVIEQINLVLDYPSETARKLINGEAQLGLIPVAAISEVPNAQIISDYCIGSDGNVETVCLFSNIPVEQVTKVRLDYQSRTSVELVKVLMNHLWKQQPQYIAEKPSDGDALQNGTAAVIIGDRAIEAAGKYRYRYDLSGSWKELTGLPFVFAAWVANTALPAEFLQHFNTALAFGISKADDVSHLFQSKYPRNFSVKDYLSNSISYEMDDRKREAIGMFQELRREL